MDFKTVAVVGLGYIGLPTAAAIATRGIDVIGVDVNASTIDSVNRGEVPFAEPDLAVAVSGAVAQGHLTAQKEMPEADVFILAVPTPFAEDHQADLTYVRAAAEAVAPVLKGGEVVILESTSPPGTTRQLSSWLAHLRPNLKFPTDGLGRPDVFVAHCPERVLPGRIMIEMVTNDRVVGGLTSECAERAADVYRTFCQGEIALTDADSAELAKLAENAFRDVNIAFANEIALVCDQLKVDVWEVIRMANRHPRVNILSPGPGVGGHCIAVDPWFIVGAAPEAARLIRTAREVNDTRPHQVVAQVVERAHRLVDPVIACLGLTFKANVDDVRESPALQIVQELSSVLPTARILAVEPHLDELPDVLANMANVEAGKTESAINEADIVLLLVDHAEFCVLRRNLLQGKIIFDTRGIWP
ncbi:MAG TPA: UDP-N-acetyl-D-mannosamine dehydrogenase [Tepidiformaceae bacterium]|jgi:UDP-N-acetyl-D-mannosaminuronic acid dehydrogenase